MARRPTGAGPVRRGLVIGPSDAGVDVDVVVRADPGTRPSPGPERTGTGGPPVGYAHVNRWSLKARGAGVDDTAARRVADVLERQPGFVAYALVRTGAREVIAVTIFETQAQLRRAMQDVAPSVRHHVRPLADAEPERRQGVVLHYRARVSDRERPVAVSPRTR
jgi:hypothetical protein